MNAETENQPADRGTKQVGLVTLFRITTAISLVAGWCYALSTGFAGAEGLFLAMGILLGATMAVRSRGTMLLRATRGLLFVLGWAFLAFYSGAAWIAISNGADAGAKPVSWEEVLVARFLTVVLFPPALLAFGLMYRSWVWAAHETTEIKRVKGM